MLTQQKHLFWDNVLVFWCILYEEWRQLDNPSFI